MAKFIEYEDNIFKNAMSFKGKHAEYLRFLSPNKSQDEETKQSKKYYLFDSYIKTFIVCTILGLKNGVKSEEDNSSKDSNNSYIKESMIFKYQEKLEYVYHMVILLDNREKPPKECVELAFSTDEAQIQQNIETVYSYFRGGIELVYEKFKDMELKSDDEFVDMVWDFIEDYYNLQNPPQPTI
jgi:hypothetical protein